MPLNDRTELFDRWAESYDARVSAAQGFPFEGYNDILDEAVRAAGAEPGMRVLDLGTGTGNLLVRFRDIGCDLWGMDMSPAMLERARERLPEAHLIRSTLPGDWPTELSERFDRVVSAYLLHEFDLKTKVEILQSIAADLLAPNGRIVVADIAFPTTTERLDAAERWAERWDPEEHYWAADEALTVCAAAGFRVGYTPVSVCGGVFTIAANPTGITSSLSDI
jgi:putative AdoMet-dependent methyltransferase